MISWICALVRADPAVAPAAAAADQFGRYSFRYENGEGLSSPGWASNAEKSIDRPIQPRRRAGLEPAQLQAELLQTTGQARGGRFADAAAFGLLFAGVHQGRGGMCRW